MVVRTRRRRRRLTLWLVTVTVVVAVDAAVSAVVALTSISSTVSSSSSFSLVVRAGNNWNKKTGQNSNRFTMNQRLDDVRNVRLKSMRRTDDMDGQSLPVNDNYYCRRRPQQCDEMMREVFNPSTTSTRMFPYCHDDIAQILSATIDTRSAEGTDDGFLSSLSTSSMSLQDIIMKFEDKTKSNCTLEPSTSPESSDGEEDSSSLLIALAIACDEWLFGDGYDGDGDRLSPSIPSPSPSQSSTSTSSSSSSLSDDGQGCDMGNDDRDNYLLLECLIKEVQTAAAATTTATTVTTVTSATTTVATMFALNLLETTIRKYIDLDASSGCNTKETTKSKSSNNRNGSPLLKDMISTLSGISTGMECNSQDTNGNINTRGIRDSSKIISLTTLSYICRVLLLPRRDHDDYNNNENGLLNFRNLIWHGFVPNVPRPWFALVVYIIDQLQRQTRLRIQHVKTMEEDRVVVQGDIDDGSDIFDLRTNPTYKSLLEQSDRSSNRTVDERGLLPDESIRLARIRLWIDQTTKSKYYIDLWDIVMSFMAGRQYPSHQQRPATICAILSVLVEHTLRLEWCDANVRPENRQARHGSYYVTLDGHGQRTVHDLVLNPYLFSSDGTVSERNQYLRSNSDMNPTAVTLDGASLAILTDLFCSPKGPNIRSAVSHGLWDTYLLIEWTCQDGRNVLPETIERRLWDLVTAILIAMDHLASARSMHAKNDDETRCLLPDDFRPQFTYVEETRRQVQIVCTSMASLLDLHQKSRFTRLLSSAKRATPNISGEREILHAFSSDMHRSLLDEFSMHSYMTTCTGPYDAFGEYDDNRRLQSLGASRLLLQELATAIDSHLGRLEPALAFLTNDEAHDQNKIDSMPSTTAIKRKTKTFMRVVRTSEIIVSFFLFCLWVATESLEPGKQPTDDLWNLVRRTRMVLSTVCTFMDSNMDRAIKSIETYARSRVVKKTRY